MQMILRAAVFAAVFLGCSLAAEEWTFIASPNFELYTTAGSGEARRTIEYFEQVRDFFERTRTLGPDRKLPITLILFRNMKQFRPYSPGEGTLAYFAGDQSRDYIVMSGAADDERPVAVHEFMHLLVRRSDVKLPVWLNEGMAELYSTLKPMGNKIAVGTAPRGRAISLALEKWIPLERLIEVTHDAPEYRGKEHAGAFYAQSWLLTHMLSLSEEYRPAFPKFFKLVTEGVRTEEAIQTAYNRSVAEISKDLSGYARHDTLNAALFPMQLRKIAVGEPGDADAVLVETHLARILAGVNQADESATRLKRLAAEHPERWEVLDALGQVAWRRGSRDEARDAIRKAVALKPAAWNVYYDYARLAFITEGEGPAVVAALREAVRLNPTHLEAKILTAEQLYRMKQYGDALVQYKAVKSVTPDLAVRLFLGMAWAHLGAEQYAEARLAGLAAHKYVREDRDKQEVNRLLDYLTSRRRAESRAAGGMAPQQAADTDAVSEVIESKPKLSSIRGVLKHVQCFVNSAKLTLAAGERTVVLLISNPDAITLRNQPGSSTTLSCGPQAKAAQVAIEYQDKPDSTTGTIGDVRSLEFLN